MNNKIIKSLVIAGLVVSTQSARATETNKTFMATRPVLSLPLEQTTWKERTSAKIGDLFGAHLQVTGFYGESMKPANPGKYFGAGATDTMTLVCNSAADHVDASRFLVGDPVAYIGTLKLAPKSISYGADFAYYQDLGKILNGLYLKVNLPVACVENDPKMTLNVADAAAKTAIETLLNTGVTYGKIHGKQKATGPANIDAMLGYKFLNKEAYHMAINLGVTIPTGNDPKAVYVFEPLYGSKHWGLGGGLDGQARIWGDLDHNIKLNFAANFRYMFQAAEKRILGLNDGTANANHANMAQYSIISTAAGATPVPGVNLLTKNVNVTPGSQLDGIIGLGYNKGGFSLDLGYNVFFKEAESVKKKDAWTDIVGSMALHAHGAALGNAAAILVASTAITEAMIKTENAATPSQFTNSIYGGVGYAFKDWEYPFMVGVGGKYEFASKNSALDGWQAWVKAGLSF